MKLKTLITEQNEIQKNIIPEINTNIKEILKEILKIQSENITSINEKSVKEILEKADLIITECHTTKQFNTSKNSNFTRLVYEYQRLNLRYEAYQINQQINNVHESYNTIKTNQENIIQGNNNLVYTILSFIASFSIVSAAVSVIHEIGNIENIMLFMVFCILLLITTLIALDNFYRYTYNNKRRLQDNYFLWKALVVVVLGILVYKGIIYIRQNQDYIFQKIGEGIGYVIKNQNGNN